jgi:hypothetical protein
MPRKSARSPESPRNNLQRAAATPRRVMDPNATYPATRQELMPIGLAAVMLGFLALMVSASRGMLLLYGDAVAHLGIARRILDSRWPGIAQLGGVWLPLPHLLMLPFVQKMEWWQNGIAGAWPSLLAYIFSVIGCYALARKVTTIAWSFAATAFFALNPNLLYLSTTAMTEPLFLALFVWSTIVAMETVEALAANQVARAKMRMIVSGVLTMAMVFTRYDGWIVGAVVWLVIALAWWRSAPGTRRGTRNGFIAFTLLSLAGPLLWFAYNAKYEGDWLDFLRGPYSAKAIEQKTTPVGSKPRRGWHNPGWAFLYYTRAAQVDAVAWELGFGVGLAALAGAWLMVKQRFTRVALLLWLPLPFYIYSVAWGSIPMFIPQMYPGSYYNSRYGMEMLPAIAIGAAVLFAFVETRLRVKSKKWSDGFYFLMLASIIFNTFAMMGTFGPMLQKVRGENAKIPEWIARPPLVYQEAVVNSSTRIPFEVQLSKEMVRLGSRSVIMFNTNDHIGAVQDAGIPLKQIIGPLDSQSFEIAKQQPAKYANLVIAIDGDEVAKAIAAHPEGLQELEVICNSGQGCARIYSSTMQIERL